MLAGILIIVFSAALLVYWVRYACVLIVRNWRDEAAAKAVEDARFSFPQVSETLASAVANLEPLEAALDRDYRILRYLMQHAAGLELASLEDRLLILDYRIMQWVYRLTRLAFPNRARRALEEMTTVLGILAYRVGAQSSAAPTA